MSACILSEKDVNAPMAMNTGSVQDTKNGNGDGPQMKSLEYHRQVLQSKMAQEGKQQYISPSDNIMSPCTAKLTALRNKQVGKAKPKSLFAQASAKRYDGDALFGSVAKDPTTVSEPKTLA